MKRNGKLVFVSLFALALALFFLLPMVGQSGGAISMDQARNKLVNGLYRGNLGNLPLFGASQVKLRGAKIGDWRNPARLSVDNDSWFFFVDEQPGANWEHKAKYVLVDKVSGALRSIPVNTPPREVLQLQAMNPAASSQLSVLKTNFQIHNRAVALPVFRLVRQKVYAVLVSGGWDPAYNYGRYWNDLSFIYKALKQKYGYTDAQIIVLYATGTHSPNGDLDGDGVNDIDYAATKANLTTVMNFVKSNIGSDGKFFFYSTNHGGQQEDGTNKAVLYLWGEFIRDDEFAALTKGLVCGEAIYVMEQCFSGGMVDNILAQQPYPCTQPKVCIMTAANYNEPSWGCDTEGPYDEYVYYWTAAVFGKTPSGAAVNADTNGDGKVSMDEAHAYAKSHDNRNEHPTSGSCVTVGCQATLQPFILLVPIKR